jgi:uncharacterized membrane protein
MRKIMVVCQTFNLKLATKKLLVFRFRGTQVKLALIIDFVVRFLLSMDPGYGRANKSLT